ncbi:MAG: queuosine precursor transporter [Parcubacteria group bacterium]|nr:queuosine precursor transporter [Parcubacteria group bacterium]
MTNILLWILLLVINFGLILLAYRLFGKVGLYSWMAIAAILANIQVLKTVELFGMVATLGNVIYGTSFLATDILAENHSKKEAKKGVWIGFFSLISTVIIMTICLWFVPHESDFAQSSLATIFSIMPRIALASLIAYLISNFHDIWAYNYWRKKFSGFRNIWIRNNLSTITSQLIDSVIFSTIAFWGVFENDVFWQIFISTFVIKMIVAICDTPFVYIAAKWKNKESL